MRKQQVEIKCRRRAMWSLGWGPEEVMSYFQEEMTLLFDAPVVSFSAFYPCTFSPFHNPPLLGLLETLHCCPTAGVLD